MGERTSARMRAMVRRGVVGVLALVASGCGEADPLPVKVLDRDVQALPPAISGGTLALSADGALALLSDPDRDRVVVIDLSRAAVVRELALQSGDEPGRIVAGTGRTAYVALRRGGGVAKLNLESATVERFAACAAPRGLAHDAERGLLHVACVGGELLTIDEGGVVVRSLQLDRDLRDVMIDGDRLLVTRFRAAEMLVLDVDGTVARRMSPAGYVQPFQQKSYEPAVAWRATRLSSGAVAMVHQRGQIDPVGGAGTSSVAYYGPTCDQAIVHSAVSLLDPDGEVVEGAGGIGTHVLPVDIAVSADGTSLAVAAAGSEVVIETTPSRIASVDVTDDCDESGQRVIAISGEPMAVAYAGAELLVQTRQPAALHVLRDGVELARVDLPGAVLRHPGHALFHRRPSEFSGVACASCHPEGRDDGRVWVFDTIGERRTQSALGGVLTTAPLHWDGDMPSFDALMHEVFEGRMGGPPLPAGRVDDFAQWIDAMPQLPSGPARDEQAALRGDVLFHDAEVGCAVCHSGAKLTNNATVDVGTGRAFQVPSLVGVVHRAPFMHDGCADSLSARFEPACGGGDDHGRISQLSSAQLVDLVQYLETL